jgi:hypothetical protein
VHKLQREKYMARRKVLEKETKGKYGKITGAEKESE